MYAIFFKKINSPHWFPTGYFGQPIPLKNVRKFRKLEIAQKSFNKYINDYPEFAWSIRCLKTNESIYNNLQSILPVWNKLVNEEI